MTPRFECGCALVLALALLVVAPFCLAETEISYRGLYTSNTLATDSLVSVPKRYNKIPEEQGLHDFVLTLQQKGLRFLGGVYVDQSLQGKDTQKSADVKELFYDFSAAGLEWSIGKKVMSWGVGYAFRPLDVIQQEMRLADRPRALEGVPLIATEVFTSNSTLTAVLFNRFSLGKHELDFAENELAINYYSLRGDADVYTVAYANEHEDYMLGAGFATVIGEHLEWHSSAAFFSNYKRYLRDPDAPLLSQTDPFSSRSFDHAAKLLTGGTWTWASGVSLLLEAWYDGTAYTKDDWQHLNKTAKEQRALLDSAPEEAVYNNLNWANRAYQSPSLLQNNVFLRLSYDGEKLDPAFDILWTPQDNGLMYRLSLDMEYNRFVRFFLTYRQFAGAKDSVFAQAPVERVIILGLNLAAVF
jgi:hypothetical protein